MSIREFPHFLNKNPTPEGPVLVTPRGGYFALAPGGGKEKLFPGNL